MRRRRSIALLAVGVAIGVIVMGTPAGAHVSGWAHNWKKHIKPRVDKLAGRAAVDQAAGVPVNNTGSGRFGTIVETSLRAPKKGFVLVTGTARLDGGTTCPCEAGMRLNTGSTSSFIYRLSKTDPTHSDTATISFLFPASKGLHAYRVQLDRRLGDLATATSDATITALFVPYNAVGKTTARIATAPAQRGG
jgi:hypothetical protein